jgi:hypothetical protein
MYQGKISIPEDILYIRSSFALGIVMHAKLLK